jgi:hypothetical protein
MIQIVKQKVKLTHELFGLSYRGLPGRRFTLSSALRLSQGRPLCRPSQRTVDIVVIHLNMKIIFVDLKTKDTNDLP